MEWNMFGVVLWSDPTDHKAVIWCEDQGDLAFYRHKDETQNLSLEAGDWVQFDVEMQRQQRLACNPRLIQGGACRSLPDMLTAAREEMSAGLEQGANDRGTSNGQAANVIPFTPVGRPVGATKIESKARHA
ncbi:hypothetical protein [Tropicibacter sp. Alg240-R139]|uniref:hypothetical protein n=1 Tax=Tropicibacter sp. Alg240-R139 TaxID=2305991 RepID=UPI0013E0942A|nr:hypothetical protein [Tropicibacter sp. Alg240-R139]